MATANPLPPPAPLEPADAWLRSLGIPDDDDTLDAAPCELSDFPPDVQAEIARAADEIRSGRVKPIANEDVQRMIEEMRRKQRG